MSDPLATIPLSAVRVFEAAARRLSFTRAAAELGMSQAAVSWQVKALERRLDQPLFRRLPREVVLTPAGERLAQAATDALRGLRAALSDISDSGEGLLAVTAVHTVATQWLAPRLGGFQLTHPKIAVRLETAARVVDLLREDVDMAIRSGNGRWPGLESVLLFPSLVTPICRPDLAARLDPTRGAAALVDAARIGLAEDWDAWFAAAGVTERGAGPEPARFAADAQVLEVAAVEGGQGAALASPIMFAREIAEGRLVQPIPVTLDLGHGVWLAYPQERARARKIRAFRDWILGCIAEDPAIARFAAQAEKVGEVRPIAGPPDRPTATGR